MTYKTDNIRLIALYLPQYHPIPENDLWWGKGFTEWINVTKAKPLFRGHYQPHLPADLGFYDLRVPEVREAQAKFAQDHGIYGFCYYHYWFNGKRVLERPFQEVFETGRPDFPFMLCWANENWTRSWSGYGKDILLPQKYSSEDDFNHIHHLIKYFWDKRYIRVDSKPFFIIYRPEFFPDIKRTLEIWREEAIRSGVGELYLAYMHSPKNHDKNLINAGFDAAVEFTVHGNRKPKQTNNEVLWEKIFDRRLWKNLFPKSKLGFNKLLFNQKYTLESYPKFINEYFLQEKLPFKLFPSLFPGWDNTPRNGRRASIFLDNTPELYGLWLSKIFENFKPYSNEENFVFIIAMNEWAEGNHLEPCQKWGTAFLEETKKSLENFRLHKVSKIND
jgi:lipopolysaccharide biosynthesis protein